ncbi:hypothetical protein [Streptomyces sp. NPDC047141]|uniref:hypothetical protein n=1 Tax=Streptomyces sp. NPDC047141 TaxID=3155738 RepID=UPI0033E3C764
MLPSTLLPARMRSSEIIAAIVAAPPTEWPAMPIRSGASASAPSHGGLLPKSWSSTKETSRARPVFTVRQNSASRTNPWPSAKAATRPSGKVVAAVSWVWSIATAT